MNITGHSKESTFLTYIGTHQKQRCFGRFIYAAGGRYLVIFTFLFLTELVFFCTNLYQFNTLNNQTRYSLYMMDFRIIFTLNFINR